MMETKKDKVICFSTTKEMAEALRSLAPTRISLSALMREIITFYLEKNKPEPQPPSAQ